MPRKPVKRAIAAVVLTRTGETMYRLAAPDGREWVETSPVRLSAALDELVESGSKSVRKFRAAWANIPAPPITPEEFVNEIADLKLDWGGAFFRIQW
jgi:hypothetical protein